MLSTMPDRSGSSPRSRTRLGAHRRRLLHSDDVTALPDPSSAPVWSRRRLIRSAGAGVAVAVTSPWWGMGTGLVTGAHAASVPAGAGAFVALPTARRLLDTRSQGPAIGVGAGGDRRLVIAGDSVPADATAAVLTVTGIARSSAGYVTIWPARASRPDVSNLNLDTPGIAVANLATVQLGAAGALDLHASAPTDLIVDLAGYYRPVDVPVRAGRYVGLSAPVRVLDTRTRGIKVPGGGTVDVILPASVPSEADAVVINLTAVDADGLGYLSCGPLGRATTDTSNLNLGRRGETRAAAAVVAVSRSGSRRGFTITSSVGCHVLVDVIGSYTGAQAEESADGLFVAVTPRRVLDTRRPDGEGRLWPGWTAEAPVPVAAGLSVGSAVVNVTAVNARSGGFLTVLAARQSDSGAPSVSHLNVDAKGQTASNHAISRVTRDAGVEVYSSSGAHVLVDLAGYFTGTPASARRSTRVNGDPPLADVPWLLELPTLGVRSWVYDGDGDTITDAGHSWHWPGTGYLGQRAHVALFAHRTEAGGPYRNIHRLRDGDPIVLNSLDDRRFTYRVVRRDITDDSASNIGAATRLVPGTTVSLIACSLANGLPTSLRYRLIVTAVLDEVVDG